MTVTFKFKAWQPYEGYQTIAIADDFEAIMWGLEHQVDIFTQDDKLVYSPNDDEESNFERLEKYGVRCVDDSNGRHWERIDSDIPTANNLSDLNKEQLDELEKDIEGFIVAKAYIENFIARHNLEEDEVWAKVDEDYKEDMSRQHG